MAMLPRSSNAVAKLAAQLALTAPLAAVAFTVLVLRSPLATGQGLTVAQPAAFDHRRHSPEQGIACLYCHGGAERSSIAGVPGPETCAGCHGAAQSKPVAWSPVHRLPASV